MSFWAPLVSMESNLAEGQGNGSTWGRKTPVSTSTKEKLERRCYPMFSGIWQLPHPNLHISGWVTACAVSCKLKGCKSGVRAYGSMVETTQGRRRALQRWKEDWVWVFKKHGWDLKLEQPRLWAGEGFGTLLWKFHGERKFQVSQTGRFEVYNWNLQGFIGSAYRANRMWLT